MSNKRKIIYVLLLLFCVGCGGYILYTSQPSYSADDPYLTIGGANIKVNETKKIAIKAHNAITADGYVSVDDSTCLQIVSVTSAFGSGNYFAAIDTTGEGLSTVATVTVKGLKDCTGYINVKNAKLGDADFKEHKGKSARSGSINVSTPTTTTTTKAPAQQQPQTTQPAQNNQPKANGSSNNLLSSLVISGYDLNKTFKSSVTNYQINVSSAVKSLNIDAKPQDSNAKVSISGNNSLKSGTNNITIVVTAENGSKKKYVVTVVKEVDPNEPQEDVKGDDVQPTEAVIVEDDSTNVYLSELEVGNTKLTKNFNKYEHVYYYNKSKDGLVINKAIPEVETNTVTTYTIDNATIIIVENELGDKGFYLLIEKNNKNLYLLYIIIGVLSIISIDLFIYALRLKTKK